MKKEYLILILVLVALGSYLVLKKEDRTHYTLPTPPAVDTKKIDRLVIKKHSDSTEFNRIDDDWVVTGNAYPADSFAVNRMLDVFKELTLSALVSEKQDLLRYELDEAHRLTVSAYENETEILSFKIGKTAPTYNHTFVMLENDPNIYHAKDSFRSHFDKSLNEFRDRRVLSFMTGDITGITIAAQDRQVRMTAHDTGVEDQESSKITFKYEDGSSPDPKTVSNLLSTLSALTCDLFMEDSDKQALEKKKPRLKIGLDSSSPIHFHLYEPEEKELPMIATSSMNAYAFSLNSYVVEDITSYAHELAELNVPEEEEAQEESGS